MILSQCVVFASRIALAADRAGVLVSSTGEIEAISSSHVSRPLRAGDAVQEGDTLKSNAASSAKFLMSDQTILDLNPGSQLQVQNYDTKTEAGRNVSVAVLDGTVRLSVNKHLSPGGRFKIRTATATMGVRGTEFVVKNDPKANQSQLTVLQGLVEAAPASAGPDAKPVGVAPGSQFTVGAIGAPLLVNLTADQLASVARSATVRDSTFVSMVEVKKSSSKATSPATASILNTARQAAARAPASQQSSRSASSASIPGNTETLRSLRTQTALLQVQNVKLNIGFTQ